MNHPREPAADGAVTRWQAAGPETLDWSVSDGECVLFHEPSGKTHLVNAATRTLLAEILRNPRDLGQIEAALGADWPADERESHRAQTLELLWRLEDLGLVVAS